MFLHTGTYIYADACTFMYLYLCMHITHIYKDTARKQVSVYFHVCVFPVSFLFLSLSLCVGVDFYVYDCLFVHVRVCTCVCV